MRKYIDQGSASAKDRVLFVCTHNSARSQMAEGLLNARFPDRFSAFSAGTEARGVHPLAIKALAEIGIDISHHRSKHLRAFAGEPFDWVVTVCSDADKACPFFPGGRRRRHVGFEDPSATEGDEAAVLEAFRRVRDEIDQWIIGFFGTMATDSRETSAG